MVAESNDLREFSSWYPILNAVPAAGDVIEVVLPMILDLVVGQAVTSVSGKVLGLCFGSSDPVTVLVLDEHVFFLGACFTISFALMSAVVGTGKG